MIAAVALSLAAFAANADDATMMSVATERAGAQTSGDTATKSCACRHKGGYALLGETVCMRMNGETYLARCDMVLNNTAWKRVQDGCAAPDALSSVEPGVAQRLAKLAEPPLDPILVHAEIIGSVN